MTRRLVRVIPEPTDKDITHLLATEVMGRTFDSRDGEWIMGDEHKAWRGEFNPLTNWDHTMMVVEQMESKGFSWEMDRRGFSWAIAEGKGVSYVCFMHPDINPRALGIEDRDLQRAICLAALQAVGVPESDYE